MRETPREVRIWQIAKGDRPDYIGITAEEWEYAGWQFMTGMGVAYKDPEIARRCYENAVRKGNHKAILYLAELSIKEGDADGYYRWILEAAMTGDVPKAYQILGQMYYEGGYVNRDYAKAYRYFELAAECKAEGAYYFLGLYAERGILGEKNPEKAVQYYRQGARQFDECCWEALKALGIDYREEL